MGGEKEPLGMSELGCADGCGRRGCKGVGGVGGNGRGEGAARDERARMRGQCEGVGGNGWGKAPGGERAWMADGCGRRGLGARTAADGVGAREWVEMGGEKEPLGMSELGCADGCGRCGCKGVGGNGWGETAAGDERAWMRGRLRTAWVQGTRGAREWVVEMGGEKEPLGISERGCADGCGRRREWADVGREQGPLHMSELGCADGCGRRGCKGEAGNGWGEGAAGDERAWMRGRLRTA
eukprot:s3374_g4.t1